MKKQELIKLLDEWDNEVELPISTTTELILKHKGIDYAYVKKEYDKAFPDEESYPQKLIQTLEKSLIAPEHCITILQWLIEKDLPFFDRTLESILHNIDLLRLEHGVKPVEPLQYIDTESLSGPICVMRFTPC